MAENCVNAQFCVNYYTKLGPKLRPALVLCSHWHKIEHWHNFQPPDVYVLSI